MSLLRHGRDDVDAIARRDESRHATTSFTWTEIARMPAGMVGGSPAPAFDRRELGLGHRFVGDHVGNETAVDQIRRARRSRPTAGCARARSPRRRSAAGEHRADRQIPGRDDHRDAGLFDFSHGNPLDRPVDSQRGQRGDGDGDGDDEQRADASVHDTTFDDRNSAAMSRAASDDRLGPHDRDGVQRDGAGERSADEAEKRTEQRNRMDVFALAPDASSRGRAAHRRRRIGVVVTKVVVAPVKPEAAR